MTRHYILVAFTLPLVFLLSPLARAVGAGASDEAAIRTVSEAVRLFLKPPERVTSGLQAFYDFTEGEGATVYDVSGVGMPLDLTIEDSGAVSWTPAGLSLDQSTLLRAASAAEKIFYAARTTQEITIEAWVRPENTVQTGSARIVTFSADPGQRNFTLGQVGDRYETRLRSADSNENGQPVLETSVGTAATAETHVVFTRDAAGVRKHYINGALDMESVLGGDFGGWDSGYSFGIGNEISSLTDPEHDRPWLGELYLVAIYNRALAPGEVAQNFLAGADAEVGAGTPSPGITHFGVAPETVYAGFSTTLTWNTTDAELVTISPGVGEVAASGSMEVFPSETTTYILTASSSNGIISIPRTVTVLPLIEPSIAYFTSSGPSPRPPIRVMPLGDSITQSFFDYPSYRRKLWYHIQSDDFPVDFVGSMTEHAGGPSVYSDFDPDHEGHGGYRAEAIITGLETGEEGGNWAKNYQPEVVLLHIGTNDLRNEQTAASTAAEIGAIIDALRVEVPEVTVLVAQIIPASDSTYDLGGVQLMEQSIQELNALLPGIAVSRHLPASPVLVVDVHDGFNANLNTWDGIHPTLAGESHIADAWYRELRPVLQEKAAERVFELAWSTSNASTVEIDPGIGSVATTGTLGIRLPWTTRLTITATGPAGTVQSELLVVNHAIVWADVAFGGLGDGSPERPYATLADAVGAVETGGIIKMFSGTTNEAPRLTKKMRLEASGGDVVVGAPGAL